MKDIEKMGEHDHDVGKYVRGLYDQLVWVSNEIKSHVPTFSVIASFIGAGILLLYCSNNHFLPKNISLLDTFLIISIFFSAVLVFSMIALLLLACGFALSPFSKLLIIIFNKAHNLTKKEKIKVKNLIRLDSKTTILAVAGLVCIFVLTIVANGEITQEALIIFVGMFLVSQVLTVWFKFNIEAKDKVGKLKINLMTAIIIFTISIVVGFHNSNTLNVIMGYAAIRLENATIILTENAAKSVSLINGKPWKDNIIHKKIDIPFNSIGNVKLIEIDGYRFEIHEDEVQVLSKIK